MTCEDTRTYCTTLSTTHTLRKISITGQPQIRMGRGWGWGGWGGDVQSRGQSVRRTQHNQDGVRAPDSEDLA